jgi:hypothetical protein
MSSEAMSSITRGQIAAVEQTLADELQQVGMVVGARHDLARRRIADRRLLHQRLRRLVVEARQVQRRYEPVQERRRVRAPSCARAGSSASWR